MPIIISIIISIIDIIIYTNCSVALLRNNPANWGLPGLQSKVCQVCVADFKRKTGTIHELESVQVRCVHVYSCTRLGSYDILVKRSLYTSLKRSS